MALTVPSMPFIAPNRIAPKDSQLALTASATFETITSTGYLNGSTKVDVGTGRIEAYWALYFSARDQASGDERYDVYLLGSNDTNWANGNVEQLSMQSFGAVKSIATILGASPTIPTVGPAGEVNIMPVTNFKSGIVYRYLRAYVVIAGTTPTMTVDSWLSYDCC